MATGRGVILWQLSALPQQGPRNATFSQMIPLPPARSQMLPVQEMRQSIYTGGMII